MAGGVILHTADSGATWDVQLGDSQSSDRSYHDLRFLGPVVWAVQSTGVGTLFAGIPKRPHISTRSSGTEEPSRKLNAEHEIQKLTGWQKHRMPLPW